MSPAPDIAAEPGGAIAAATARDVARGVARLFFRQERIALCEVPLGNGRRADILALDGAGRLTLVEIKISRADLRGDAKWLDYLDYCDQFYWAVPAGFALDLFDTPAFLPDRTGLIVADRYDAAVLREASAVPLASARRRVETLRFARGAARRLLGSLDPGLAGLD